MKKLILSVIPLVIICILFSGIFLSGRFYNSVIISENYIEPDSSYAAYFPLNIGNTYIYLNTTTSLPPIPPYKSKARITKDTMIAGKKYFYCNNFPFIGTGWVRFDTATGNLLLRSSPGCSIYSNDKIIDSLRSKINNQITCQFGVWYTRRCLDTAMTNIFNMSKKSILFLHDGLMYGNMRFAKNFGIIYYCAGEPPPCSSDKNLLGCIINGVVYGDTSMTFVKTIIDPVPNEYRLYQNYPNPFNPATNIKFAIPKNEFVKITAFDMLGKEIETLVNERLAPGTYETNWNASNYPSGIYFYRLQADDFSETKRMTLIK
jgi:hypothetical protein